MARLAKQIPDSPEPCKVVDVASVLEMPIVTKRGPGRPRGVKDVVKRQPKTVFNKPSPTHGAIGRPKGSKDKVPRKRYPLRLTEVDDDE